MTKPLRRLSKGMEAAAGSELVVSAMQLWKPAKPRGVIAASEPPAITASA